LNGKKLLKFINEYYNSVLDQFQDLIKMTNKISKEISYTNEEKGILLPKN